MTLEPSPAFRHRLLSELGEEAEAALAAGQAALGRLTAEWGLTFLGPLAEGYCSLVSRVRLDDGREGALKVPVMGEERDTGAQAAVAFSGRGGIEVWRHDPMSGTLLMPLARPGTLLMDAGLGEAGTWAVWLDVARRLRCDAVVPSIPLEDWCNDLLEADVRLVPEDCWSLVDGAASVARRLLRTAPPGRLLHGDLHQENVLRAGDDWLAIDPKGVWGDPAFEPAAALRQAWPDASGATPDLASERIDRVAAVLRLPPLRVWGWAFAGTVLSALWDGEEGLARERPVALAFRALADPEWRLD